MEIFSLLIHTIIQAINPATTPNAIHSIDFSLIFLDSNGWLFLILAHKRVGREKDGVGYKLKIPRTSQAQTGHVSLDSKYGKISACDCE